MARRHRPLLLAATAASLLLLAGALAACTSEPDAGPTFTVPPSPSPSPSGTPATPASPGPTPTGTSTTAPSTLPTDCRAILSPAVLAQLGTTPLNDPSFGPSGVQDGKLVCIWANPGADTGLTTDISKMSRGPALDLLNSLANGQGFTCYTPHGGTRCEKTWQDTAHGVAAGRTLFWRDDILIDTTYSGIAPSGYTDAIVSHLFP